MPFWLRVTGRERRGGDVGWRWAGEGGLVMWAGEGGLAGRIWGVGEIGLEGGARAIGMALGLGNGSGPAAALGGELVVAGVHAVAEGVEGV